MRAQLVKAIERIRGSYWFLPTVLSTLSFVLATITLSLDDRGRLEWLSSLSFIYTNGPDGARAFLSTVAGTIMNVTGVVFSLTIVSLSLASQQFGPRLLSNFMRDRGNQVVLGSFVATFLYCLLVLRTIGAGSGDSSVVPHLSVAVALLLTLVTLGLLIYFIHHLASSIQVHNVIRRVATGLEQHIEALEEKDIFPSKIGHPPEEAEVPADLDERSASILSTGAGYLQAVDTKGLIRLARRHDALLRIRHRPGAFIMQGSVLCDVYPPERCAALEDELHRSFAFGAARTQAQDTEYLFDQLLELALRALSPSMNDPFTATACIDRISDALSRLGRRRMPSPYRADESGKLRVLAPSMDLPDLTHRVLATLRNPSSRQLTVSLHMLRVFTQVADDTPDEGLREAIEDELRSLLQACRTALPDTDYATLLKRNPR